MDGSGDYGIRLVSHRLNERLRQYIEAQYHVRDSALIAERRALLEEPGAIAQEPYIETTPRYLMGKPYDGLAVPFAVREVLTQFSRWKPGVGVYPEPYAHQAEALEAFFGGQDLVVSSGTGSGKTETFLWPILGSLALESTNRPASFRLPGMRALILYPMNALVSDQLRRLRGLFGDQRVAEFFTRRYGRFPRFGTYTGRTPYPGSRDPKKDDQRLGPLVNYYLSLESPEVGLDQDECERRHGLARELKALGRWPAKDLKAFAEGSPDGRAPRYTTHPSDRELLTRHEMQLNCPDILVTNYSMLEYMLLRPIERPLFKQTRDWLQSSPENALLLVLDEAHMYRGTGGAEVAFLIRRLQARLGIPRERLRCVITSASLGTTPDAEEAARQLAVALTGCPQDRAEPFRSISGRQVSLPDSRPATRIELKALAGFPRHALNNPVNRAEACRDASRDLAEALGWPLPPAGTDAAALRQYLFERLQELPPFVALQKATTGNAVPVSTLAKDVFPDESLAEAEAALGTLLALGSYANDGKAPLLSTRAHLLFRGVPTLCACINPECDQRRYRPGEKLLLGRLYTEPRTHCTCKAQARVYELYTHRDCGAAFLRVFGRGSKADFYWHEQGGVLFEGGLDEDFLLVEEPGKEAFHKGELEPIWVEMRTGRVVLVPPSDDRGYRLFYRSNRPAGVTKTAERRKQAARPGRNTPRVPFSRCPACGKESTGKIMDLATKGEQPFAVLVFNQLQLQPASRPPSAAYPNAGKKVLLFSDGRQKAARLARDLPREVEFDTFRQAIVLAATRLVALHVEPRIDSVLYRAFLDVCYQHNLRFFDAEEHSLETLNEHLRYYREYFAGNLEDALSEEWHKTPPPRYGQALLRQLCDPFYSLHAACAGSVQPTRRIADRLRQRIGAGSLDVPDEMLDAIAYVWIECMLDRAALDPRIPEETRCRVNRFFSPVSGQDHFARFERALSVACELSTAQTRQVERVLRDLLAESDERGNQYLQPSALSLVLALNQTWYQCRQCSQTQIRLLSGRCGWCGSQETMERRVDDPYMIARKGYFRDALRFVLEGGSPVHLTAEEHTAQLSHRDESTVYATTEEYELRFQDVSLSADKPPIDVLSCTTTMEVGVDIGSLVAIGLRNVPPRRENYQQRAGRAGRRGASVSTVVTYAQDGPHDGFYYHNPAEIVSGPPRRPRVNVNNRRLARRHVCSHLVQTFFHQQLDDLPPGEQIRTKQSGADLFSALGPAGEFLAGDGPFSLASFESWVGREILTETGQATAQVALWLPDGLVDTAPNREAEKASFVRTTAMDFLEKLRRLAETLSAGGQEAEGFDPDTLLLDLLFEKGLLPTYAFPTHLCPFYVFGRNDQNRVIVKQKPEQSKTTALSEYAPGRLLVINKQTYRVGGIYTGNLYTLRPAESLFASELPVYSYCPVCTYSTLGHQQGYCPTCGHALESREMLDPPGFSPESGQALSEREHQQELSYATSAQFPLPLRPDTFEWKCGVGARLKYAYGVSKILVVVNKGPDELGFQVCESCGAAWPVAGATPQTRHRRPFVADSRVYSRESGSVWCSGPLHEQGIYLGHRFPTDVLLLRVSLGSPLCDDPAAPWLTDALVTLSEALSLAASLYLDVDPGELSAGFRLVPATLAGGDDAPRLQADIFLYDTASGGAGYAAEAGEELRAVLQRTAQLLRECPNGCERSCTQCLRHYGNRYWHTRLDRHLALGLLSYAMTGAAPPLRDVSGQIADLAALKRYLELEGLSVEEEAMVGDVVVPLLARRPGTQEAAAAIGVFPALLDRSVVLVGHPVGRLNGRRDTTVVLLDDYTLSRDLPAAHERVQRAMQGGRNRG